MSHRVLVVDDEESVRITLAGNLELAGFTVLEAESGAQALEVLAREPVDLVLSDIKMPGISGVELYFKIRERWAEIPVVLMTAFAVEDQVHRALENGVFSVLAKPFQLDQAVRTLRNAVRRPMVLVHDRASDTAEELAKLGLRTRAVLDAGEAAGALKDVAVDVCVADAALARSTLEAARAAGVSIALVVLVESSGGASLEDLAASGAYAFFNKPVRAGPLAGLIARARGDARVKS
jgi:DNA-binding NtrC family response regulator